MKKYYISALIAFLFGVTIFSVYQYASSYNERLELRAMLQQAKQDAQIFESQNQSLHNDLKNELQVKEDLQSQNERFKQSLKEDAEQIAKLTADLQKRVDEAGTLRRQIAALKAEKENLSAQVSELSREKEGLHATLDSIPDLKSRIRELARLKRQARRTLVQQLHEAREGAASGNRGYLMKDGKTTFAPRIRIEVQPTIR